MEFQIWLMNKILRRLFSNPKLLNLVSSILLTGLFTSCEKDIKIDIGDNEPQLIVEAYINNLMPEYNYVILTKSMDYFAPDFQGVPVSNAQVTITEGESSGNGTFRWNSSTRIAMEETNNSRIPAEYRKGLYVDQKTIATFSTGPSGLIAKPGKYYLLEISSEGKNYSAITSLPSIITIDSLTTGHAYIDEAEGNIPKARVTVNYKDPDTIGNRQLFYWRQDKNRDGFGWGALSSNRRINGTDDLTNGQYLKLTQPYGFNYNELVNYYMVSVTREVYTFWDSFNKARNNDGPFSTPVELISNIRGENVTGCFSGFAVSTKAVVVKP
ncbi:MAG: DUF4249 domain-containing protein [Chitinophagaceae bacterium]|nr:MAG: DUF4249 domain-containing protein [Chitinophagaceae bacterium]